MASRSVKRLGLSQEIVDRLHRAGLSTCKDILLVQPSQLQHKLQLNIFIINEIYKKAATKVSPVVNNLLTVHRQQKNSTRHLSTTFAILDKVLHGGISAGSITEIAGPSGCGKTQLCFMMCVVATLPVGRGGGLAGKILYIDTESAFSAHRLVEIARNKFPEVYSSEESLENLASKVLVHQENTCQSLNQRIGNLEEELIEHDIKLVIVDSIASLIRKEFGGSCSHSNIHRTNLLTTQASSLKKLAQDFSIPILVTNQITTRFGSDDVTDTGSEAAYATAALGNSWSHNVNTRFILQYSTPPLRQIRIAKSPVAPFVSLTYTIEAEGLVLQAESGECYEGTDPGLQAIQVRTALPGSLY